MVSLLCGLAFAAPDEALLSSLAAVEARAMLPIVVGVHDDLLMAEINRADVQRDDLHLVVILLHDERPGWDVQKVMKSRSMRCGVEIVPADKGTYTLAEYGRCDARKKTPAPEVAPEAPVAPPQPSEPPATSQGVAPFRTEIGRP